MLRKLKVYVLSLVLCLSMVPTAALAEAADQIETLAPILSFCLNAQEGVEDSSKVWVSYASKEDAQKAVEEAQAAKPNTELNTQEAESPAQVAEPQEQQPAEQPADEVPPAEEVPAQDEVPAAETTQPEGQEGTNDQVPANDQTPKAPTTSIEMRLDENNEGVEYRVRKQGADWDDPEQWFTSRLDAQEGFVDLQVRLTGELATTHDVWYRVHTNGAWLEWAKNGASAAAQDANTLVDDIQAVIAPKQETEETAEQPVEQKETESQVVQKETTEDVKVQVQQTQKKDEQANKKQDTNAALTTQKETPVPTVTYQAHVQKIGWQKEATNGGVAGTSGRSLRVEAIKIKLPAGIDGGITYQAHVQKEGWQSWRSNGEMAGTSGKSRRVEAMCIKLTGNIEKIYDVWYRTHVQKVGWQDWVKNGEMAGTSGRSLRIEALQIVILPKGSQKPAGGDTEPTTGADYTSKGSVSYRASVGGMGWLGWVSDGDRAGTFASNTWMNGFVAELSGKKISNSELHYSAVVEGEDWQSEVLGGTNAGRPGTTKRLQAVRLRLTGNAANLYDIYYRTYINGEGWLKWAKNNEKAGYIDSQKGVQVLEVKLVTKGGAAPSSSGAKDFAFSGRPELTYRGHVQKIGWQDWVKEGETAGTSGRSLRVEALQAKIANTAMSGEIQLRSHVQRIGWQDWVGQGGTSGTSGRSLRVEALQARLTGELANKYDVYYRVHAQKYGWLGWAKNGESAGTAGLSLRLEAIELRLVEKGGAAPGSTSDCFVDGSSVGKIGYQNPAGYYQVSSFNVRITNAATYPFNYITPSRISKNASRSDCVNAFLDRAREYLGTPYKWNYACAPGVGVDCIGLVYQCAYACGMDMGGGTGDTDFNPWAHWITGASGWHSHDSNNFWNYGNAKHVPVSQKKAGDVLYWPGHVAIYMGSNTIIEAYDYSTGVIQVNLSRRDTPTGCIRLFQ
ncbi:MAG: NlpC/P60 family protein [Coriobacteriales bacterium]|nr:NlpC/P60 family protein [Coriobacteriales bacterium]